tara:strand:+ start:26 stop:613 length:588 start_codon:yes stop_codon:yes gene_type:complete
LVGICGIFGVLKNNHSISAGVSKRLQALTNGNYIRDICVMHIYKCCAQAKKTNRYKMKLTLTAILFCFLNLAFGQTDKEQQIDTELQNCLDTGENYTTKGMTDCVVQATEKWDLELNKNYQKLLNILTAEQKEKLKLTQREWVEYRDKEIEFSNQLYYDMQGTMWIPIAAETKLDLTRKRTVEPENYIANLTIDN